MGGAWADKNDDNLELRWMASCDNFGSCWCLDFMLAAVEVLEVIWEDMDKALNDDEFVFTECRWSAFISENPSSHQYRFMYHQINVKSFIYIVAPVLSTYYIMYAQTLFKVCKLGGRTNVRTNSGIFTTKHTRSRLEAIMSGSSKHELFGKMHLQNSRIVTAVISSSLSYIVDRFTFEAGLFRLPLASTSRATWAGCCRGIAAKCKWCWEYTQSQTAKNTFIIKN